MGAGHVVSLAETTLGAVMEVGIETLFGPPEPTPLWAGKTSELYRAGSPLPKMISLVESTDAQ